MSSSTLPFALPFRPAVLRADTFRAAPTVCKNVREVEAEGLPSGEKFTLSFQLRAIVARLPYGGRALSDHEHTQIYTTN